MNAAQSEYIYSVTFTFTSLFISQMWIIFR